MAGTAAEFDAWYANMAQSTRHADIVRSALGLPPALDSSSLLPWSGIAVVVDALALGAGDTFADLGCGRGGYGIEVARRTGASLVGVDFAAVALEQARLRAGDVTATFRVGELTATGLAESSLSAAMCIDAMQFADPYPDGLRESLRILRPGGRLVLTGWMPDTGGGAGMPARLQHDVGAHLDGTGFADVVVRDMTDWHAAELALWEAARDADPDGDPAVESLRDEGARVLPWLAESRRILATARRPG